MSTPIKDKGPSDMTLLSYPPPLKRLPESRVIEKAKKIFEYSKESFASLESGLQGKMIAIAIQHHPIGKLSDYLTPVAVSSALNQELSPKVHQQLLEIVLKRDSERHAVTLSVPELDEAHLNKELEGLKKELIACEKLVLKGSQITHLGFLKFLPNLKDLDVSDCRVLTSLSGVEHCPKLEVLNVSGSEITDLDALKGRKIKKLTVHSCGSLSDVSGIEHSGLEHLDLSDDLGLDTLEPVQSLTSLKVLKLQGLPRLSNIQQFTKLPELQTLDITNCDGVLKAEREMFSKTKPGVKIVG